MAPKTCKVGGCDLPIPTELLDHSLCLEHFLSDVVERARTLARQLGEAPEDGSLRDTALRFIVLSAARLATIGTGNPPTDQLARGRLLNAMLMLADLREKLDKTGATAR